MRTRLPEQHPLNLACELVRIAWQATIEGADKLTEEDRTIILEAAGMLQTLYNQLGPQDKLW